MASERSVLLIVLLVISLMNSQVIAQVQSSCITETAVCSLKSQIRGTITFGETQGAGCFNNGNFKVNFDLVGFPSASININDNNNKNINDNNKKDDVYTFRLKTYGEIMPACSGMGPDFGAGITAGELGVFTPSGDGHIFNDTTYIPRSSSIPDRNSIIGRSVGIYAGPYSNYGNNVIVDCCVIGYGLPRAGASPTVAPTQSGTAGLFGKRGLGLTGANNNNNLNARNTISDDKFKLIGGYGNSRAFDGASDRGISDPQFGYQETSRQPFRGTSTQNLYGSNPFRTPTQGSRGFGNSGRAGPTYDNIYSRGNNNYNNNNGAGNYFDETRQGSPNSAGGQGRGSGGYSPSSGSYNNNGGRDGFSNSQFPSVFNNIGSPDFFNLDGELAGAAFVKGGPPAAAGIGSGGARGSGGDSSLGVSLAGGFKPPQGPSFQDIYNKPTGESPLSGLGFSDTVAPERRNSISDLFFGDGSIKDTIGLTEDDMFIPRENEESESSSSYQSESGDYPDSGSNDGYNIDNDDSYDASNNAYDISKSNVPYESSEESYSYSDYPEDEVTSPSQAEISENEAPVEASGSASEDVTPASGPKPVYRSGDDIQ
ncbi:hypothetical protein ElyMa_004774700 [Elysia marginata]|uniref:Uncharacterized protein n=1 Tax=Elysia marginata TaxID=1093978 RepID=A0AAV4IHY7_9GAST|nr:hypothetical protein ElyMa_004774700 [Elysia marginata]